MAWSNRRYSRKKKTPAQQLAQYKRQQEKQRKLREQRKKHEEEMNREGGFKNPKTPKFCRFSEFPQIYLSIQQTRYRGTTNVIAYLKSNAPKEFTCAMQGHCRETTITRERYERYQKCLGTVKFGRDHYKHPLTVVPYETFIKFYVVYERFDAYLD